MILMEPVRNGIQPQNDNNYHIKILTMITTQTDQINVAVFTLTLRAEHQECPDVKNYK